MNAQLPILPKRLAIQLGFACVAVSMATTSIAGGPTNNPPTAAAAKQIEAAKPVEIAKSTFVMPRNKTEGRDPFHPSSTYPYEQSGTKSGGTKLPPAPVDLKLTGIGGTSERPIANINNRAFGKGEDGEMTVGGSKVQIHILDILEDSVVLTVNGEQRELHFRRFIK